MTTPIRKSSFRIFLALIVTMLIATACQQENLWELAEQGETEPGFVTAGSMGQIYYSNDGVSWTASSYSEPANTYYGIAVNRKGTWMIAGTRAGLGIIYTSTDGGATWQQSLSSVSATLFNAIATDGMDNWIAVGGTGRYAISSSNGKSWTVSFIPPEMDIYGITCNQDRFVTVGTNPGGYHYSDNGGMAWAPTADPGIMLNATSSYQSYIVAVGASGSLYRYNRSANSWAASAAPFSPPMRGIAYGNGRLIAAGTGGNIFYSGDDGSNWTPGSNTGTNHWGIAYGKNTWVVVGEIAAMTVGRIHYSTDNGASWSSNVAPGGPILHCIAFGKR